MSGSSGSLCRVPVSNLRCGLCFPELGESGARRWTLASVSLNSRRFLADNRKFFVVTLIGKSRPAGVVGSIRIQALQTDEERRRLRSKSSNYAPPSPSDPDLDELPLLRGGSRRNPQMEEDGGFDEREDVREDDNKSQPLLALWRGVKRYILAGIFVLGMGAGITVDTVLNVEPNNVASREVIDRQTPNPDVCIANGMSAMVLDQRLFISFNPFNVYVSQTEVKPGCVLRQSNWSVLEARGLVTSDEVRACKRNMNTFGFVGDLRQAPEISCVYHSESAENQFLKDPSKATLGDGYQPKSIEE